MTPPGHDEKDAEPEIQEDTSDAKRDRTQEAIEMIEKSEKIKELVRDDPDSFRKKVEENEKLKEAFKDADLEKVIRHYDRWREVIRMIEESPRVKDMIQNNPEEFRKKVNEKMAGIFEGVDIEEVIRYYQ